MKTKNSIEIRHPKLEEMDDIAILFLTSFNDIFSHIFQEKIRMGEKIFRKIFISYNTKKDLIHLIVAVRENEILGCIEIHNRTRLPSFLECISFYLIFSQRFGLIKSVKKVISLLLLLTEFVRKKHLYIGTLAIKPEARRSGIARSLIDVVEALGYKMDCKYLSLDVMFSLAVFPDISVQRLNTCLDNFSGG